MGCSRRSVDADLGERYQLERKTSSSIPEMACRTARTPHSHCWPWRLLRGNARRLPHEKLRGCGGASLDLSSAKHYQDLQRKALNAILKRLERRQLDRCLGSAACAME